MSKYLLTASLGMLSCISYATPLSEQLINTFQNTGLEEAVEEYQAVLSNDPSSIKMEDLRSLSATLAENENYTAALEFLHLNAVAYPESIQVYKDLALIHFNLFNSDSSRIYITQAEELDPLLLSTIILRKSIFFVPSDFIAPSEFTTEDFYIRPISGEDAELDYPAVMSSIDHIKQIMGSRNWPTEQLSLEEDRGDLARHEGEMVRGEKFVYTVLNREQTQVLGCIYIFPSRWDDHDAEISMWTTEEAYNDGLDEALFSSIKEWITAEWPFDKVVYPGRDTSFGEFYAKLGAQDEQYH